MARFVKRGDRHAAGVLAARWWPTLEFVVAALLIVLLGAYLLAARELFFNDGETITTAPDAGLTATPASTGVASGSPEIDAAPLVAADGSGTALARNNPGRTGASDAVGPSRLPTLLWSLQIGVGLAEPVVADGIVYAGSGDGIVYALETATGAIRWRFPTPGAITGSPAVAAGTVYVASVNTLYAIDVGTGKARWNRPLFGSSGAPAALAWASPLVAGDTVYVAEGSVALADDRLVVAGTIAATVFAVATESGTVRWASELANQGLHALATVDGRPLWQLARTAQPPGQPAIGDGVVWLVDYVTAEAGRLAAVDLATGALLWTDPVDRGSPSMPAVAGETVLLVTGAGAGVEADGALTALVPGADGAKTIWQIGGLDARPGSDERAAPPATIAGRIAYVGTADGTLLAVDLATGRQRWRVETGPAGLGPPAVAGNTVFVATADGRLMALGAATTSAAAASPVAAATSPTPAPAANRFRAGQIVYIVVDEARLRAFPTEAGTEVLRLPRGTSLQIVDAVLTGNEQFGYWWQVRLPSSPGVEGYVRDEQIADGVTAGQPTPTAVPVSIFADGQTVAVVADGIAIWPSPYPTGARAVAWLMRGDRVVLDGGSAIVATGERWVRVRLASDATVVGYVQEAYLSGAEGRGDGRAVGDEGAGDVAAPGVQTGEIVLVMDIAVKLYRNAGDESDWIEVLSMRDGWVVSGPAQTVDGVVWWPVANLFNGGTGWVKESEVVGAGMAPDVRVGADASPAPATARVAGTPVEAVRDAGHSPGTPVATTTPAATATSGRFQAGDVVRVTEDDVQVHPEPTTRNAPITILPSRTELLVTGPAIAVEGVVWWPVDDPIAGLSGYVMDGFVEPRDRPQPTPTPGEVPDDGAFAPGDLVAVNDVNVTYRPSPRGDQDPIRVLVAGEDLVVTGEPIEADGLIWLPVEDAFGVSGYVAADSVALVARAAAAPTATPRLVATVDAALTADPPDLRSVELTMAIEVPELAARDADALADLHLELEQNLRFFRRNGCRPVLVVLAVGAAEAPTEAVATAAPEEAVAAAAPEEAVAAAAAVEGVLRDVYDPVFRSVDMLRFADAGTLAGRVRIRVYYYEC